MKKPTLEQLRESAERELSFRKRVYRRLVEQGKMEPEKADFELLAMAQIILLIDAVRTGRTQLLNDFRLRSEQPSLEL